MATHKVFIDQSPISIHTNVLFCAYLPEIIEQSSSEKTQIGLGFSMCKHMHLKYKKEQKLQGIWQLSNAHKYTPFF